MPILGQDMDNLKKPAMPEKKAKGTWIQTDRSAHEAWALLAKKPAASSVMHILCANLGEHNAVVISQQTLAKICGLSERSVRRAIADLVDGNWIEVRQIGATRQTNAYIVNDRVAWQGARDGLKYSLFSANIVVSSSEQPDANSLGQQKPLRQLPKIGELQMPFGDGLEPPSQQFLPDMELELPTAGQQKD